MKKLFCFLFFFIPFVACAQQHWYKASPSDFIWQNVGNAGFSTSGVYYTSIAVNPTNGLPYVPYQNNLPD